MDRVRARVLAAVGVLLVLVAGALVLQWQAGQAAPSGANATPGAIALGPDDFAYGPQTWRPYSSPLPVDPDDPEARWRLVLVPLNGTPTGPGAFTGLGEAVAVHYRASSLSGRMAFAVYATGDGEERGWTNRPTGYGASGYYVTGTELPAERAGDLAAMPTGVPVELAVFRGADLAEDRATVAFLRNNSGLDGIHLTRSLVERKGQVTRTAAQEGTFYVTATGGGRIERAYLLVAVDRAQPLSFGLSIESRTVEVGGGAGG